MSSEVLRSLLMGYERFRQGSTGVDLQKFSELAQFGQQPKTLVIACSDSRVDPAIIMDCGPGDLFIVRNVANLVPPYEPDGGYHGTSAALEFAVCGLEVENILLLGHTQCGGINALLQSMDSGAGAAAGGVAGAGAAAGINPPNRGEFIAQWMQLALPAYRAVCHSHNGSSLHERVDACAQYAMVNSLDNLMTFPWVKQRVESGKLTLNAWCFDLATTKMTSYDYDLRKFVDVA